MCFSVGECVYSFFKNEKKDAAIMTVSTLAGGLVGVLTSLGASPQVMLCNVLCDAAYSGAAGIGLAWGLKALDAILQKSYPFYKRHHELFGKKRDLNANCLQRLYQSPYRDVGIVTTTAVVVAGEELLRSSLNDPSSMVLCLTLCGFTYGNSAGITISWLLRAHEAIMKCRRQQGYVEVEDEAADVEDVKALEMK